jgi:NodT family efflux transporter outer membrane factor (OMF) lipoprotein
MRKEKACSFLKKRTKRLLCPKPFQTFVQSSRTKVFCFFFSKKKFLLPFFAVALSSCDLAPKYQAPLTKVDVSYKESVAFSPAHPLDGLPRGAWWAAFGDPELDRLESQLDQGSPNLAASLASLSQARALAAEARSGLFPSLSVGGHINADRQSNRRPTRGPGQPNQYLDNAIDAQAHYEIDIWDRVANAIKVGRYTAQASAADVETLRLSLHAELAEDYVDLVGLDAQARVLTHATDAYRQAVQLTENRFAGKIASGLDVSRAESQLGNAEAAQTDIAMRRALAEHAIAALVGKLPGELSIAPAEWVLVSPPIDSGLPSELLERRPDVASAERQMAAANANIGVARAAFYPTLSLDVLYGLQDTGFNLFSLPNDFFAVGPGLVMPLFEGGLRRAEQAAAVAAYREAAAQYRATVLGAFQDVEDSLAQRRLLADESAQEDSALRAARRTLGMDMNLYRDGATDFLDVVVAQATELQSEQMDVDLRTRRLHADLSLIRALGGGWRRKDLPDFTHNLLQAVK